MSPHEPALACLPLATQTESVLLMVEDDPDDAFMTRHALEKHQIPQRIIHVRDGEEAIKYLKGDAPYNDRAEFPLPVLMLLDLKMPKVTGFDVLDWLRTRPELASIPVVILTGSIHKQDRIAAHKLGAAGFEVRPVDFKALTNILEGVGNRWLK
jgi:CheY-like chemotaxis protein